MATVRCKFTCVSKTEKRHWDPGKGFLYDYEFVAVTGGSEENKAFFEATPSGALKVQSAKHDFFVVGGNYYLDIIPAE